MDTTKLTDLEVSTVEYYEQYGREWACAYPDQDRQSFWTNDIEQFAQLLPQGKILEIGSGAGVEAQLLCEKGYDYIGIDISDTLLAMAREKNQTALFLYASLYDLPFKSLTFDGFWAAAVFLHVPKKRIDEAFSALKKVLKPGAVGFISLKAGNEESVDEKGRFFSYYQSQEFTEILKRNNFEVVFSYERINVKRINAFTWLSFFVRYKC